MRNSRLNDLSRTYLFRDLRQENRIFNLGFRVLKRTRSNSASSEFQTVGVEYLCVCRSAKCIFLSGYLDMYPDGQHRSAAARESNLEIVFAWNTFQTKSSDWESCELQFALKILIPLCQSCSLFSIPTTWVYFDFPISSHRQMERRLNFKTYDFLSIWNQIAFYLQYFERRRSINSF